MRSNLKNRRHQVVFEIADLVSEKALFRFLVVIKLSYGQSVIVLIVAPKYFFLPIVVNVGAKLVVIFP